MMPIVLPSTLDAAAKAAEQRPSFELKAGGTDVVDRLRHRAAAPEGIIQLKRLAGLDAIAVEATESGAQQAKIGALVSLADVALHPALRERAPLLVACVEATATPQIRGQATVGGALCQRPRCVYFRDEQFSCAKKGGESCLARQGDHSDHAVFDNAACMAPHPSTLAAGLMAVGATVTVHRPGNKVADRSVDALFTIDLMDPTVENSLRRGSLITSVQVPLPVEPPRGAYLRASSRKLADWASAEVAVKLELHRGQVRHAAIVLGGVSRTPRRAQAAERLLNGLRPSPRGLAKVADAAAEGATPLKANAWKVDLIKSLTLTALEEALA